MRRKTITVWLATDMTGDQWLFPKKPEKHTEDWRVYFSRDSFNIGKKAFKQTFDDEPRKIEMVLKEI